MSKFFVTEEQKEKLKLILSKEEYDALMRLEWEEFHDEIIGYAVMRYENDEPTKEALTLEDIQNEVLNQNDPN